MISSMMRNWIKDLHVAARAGDLPQIERLLLEGVDINARDRYGQTALMLAATRGHDGAARLLIEHGATLDASAKYNLTALMLAVLNRHEAVARVLVDAGADTEVRGTGAPGFSNLKAAELAVHHGMGELADYIVNARVGR